MTCFDEASMASGYARYLAAKTTVDDRALNRHVLAELRRLMPAGAPQVLEVGAGTALALGLGLTVRALPWPVATALVVGAVLLAVGARRERRPVAGFGTRLADLR